MDARLLGPPTLSWRGRPVEVRARKTLALLSVSLLRPATRTGLAELLWAPGKLANVRQALYELRQLPGADEWLVEEGERLAVRGTSDVRAFEEALAQGDVDSALAGWGGVFLDGLEHLTPAFQEWLEEERARLEGLHQRAQHGRLDLLERSGELELARMTALHLLRRDPIDETALRAAMRLTYLLDDPAGALALYARAHAALRSELHVDPVRETQELARVIAGGAPLPAAGTLASLRGADLRLVRLLAVAGAVSVGASLAAALGVDGWTLSEAVAGLQRRGILDDDGLLPPGLAVEVRSRLPAPVLRHAHWALAHALESDEGGRRDPASIALHWRGAGDAARAATWSLVAAQGASTAGDEAALRVHAFRTLWMGSSPARLEAALLLESSAERSADAALQASATEEAARIAWELQDDRAIARLLLVRGRQAVRRRDAADALQLMREAADVATRLGDRRLIEQVENGLGTARYFMGDLDAAAEHFAVAARGDDAQERYRALNNLAAIDGIGGRFDAAYERLAEALTLARQAHVVADVAGLLNNLAATAERAADYDRAARHLREARGLARRAGEVDRESQMLVNAAIVHTKRGALGLAWNTVAEVADRVLEPAPHVIGSAVEQLAEIARIAGAHELALDRFGEAERRFELLGDGRKVAAVRSGTALVRLASAPDRAAAVEAARTAVATLAASGQDQLAAWHWAEIAILVHDADDALAAAACAATLPQNRQLELLVDLARLRAAAMGSNEPSPPVGFTDRVADLEVVERPLALVVLAACEGAGRSTLERRAREELREQAAGLPPALRRARVGMIDRWSADLAR
ncbi:hypothetical protein BH23DEI1_BH23DEI1_13050 [soil metagenome]